MSRWARRLEPRKRSISSTTSQAICDVVRTRLALSPCVTCSDMCRHIQESLALRVSRSLVLNVMHRLGYSYKRVRKRGVPRNVRAHEEAVQEFEASLRSMLATHVSTRDTPLVVSVDESGFDHRFGPLYGFSPRGVPAVVRYTAVSDRTRYNLLLAVASDGGRYHHVHPGHVAALILTTSLSHCRSLQALCCSSTTLVYTKHSWFAKPSKKRDIKRCSYPPIHHNIIL